MVTILCALVSILEFRVRSRASLELELIALRHQVTVLRRQRRGRPQLSFRSCWSVACMAEKVEAFLVAYGSQKRANFAPEFRNGALGGLSQSCA